MEPVNLVMITRLQIPQDIGPFVNNLKLEKDKLSIKMVPLVNAQIMKLQTKINRNKLNAFNLNVEQLSILL